MSSHASLCGNWRGDDRGLDSIHPIESGRSLKWPPAETESFVWQSQPEQMRAQTFLSRSVGSHIFHASGCGFIVFALCALGVSAFGQRPSTPYGTSYQVNVDVLNRNIAGDAANEPALCIDPTQPNRLAIGWRQFNRVTDSFRQAGWAYSTNGGMNWIFPGVLETNVFRSDPGLAADADGRFYYLSLLTNGSFHTDLWRSTNGGQSWEPLGLALGGDKEWMAIDTVTGSGNIYQVWSPYFNYTNNTTKIFSR